MALLKTNTGIGTTNPTSALHVIGDVLVTGVVTATSFNGNIISQESTLGFATATNLSVSGVSTFVGVATAQSTLFANQLSVSGFSTLSDLQVSGLTPDGTDFGGTQYLLRATGSGGWEWADVPGIFSVNNILNGFNVSDEGFIVGTAGSITQLDFRGSNIIATADPQPNGIATIRVSDTPTFESLVVTGITTLGVTTSTSLFANDLSISGVSTFVGVGTFQNDLYVGGNLFILNDLVFDEATLRNINVTGISTFNIVNATTLNVTGVTTLTSLDVTDINASGIVTALNGFVGNLTGTATTATNLSDAANITTGTIDVARLTGTYDIDISGNAATADYADVAGIATYATTAGVATDAVQLQTARDFSVSGDVATASPVSFDGTGNVDLAVTLSNTFSANTSGIITAYRFSGILEGYATNAGVATYADFAGIATYASNAGIATYADFAGIATYATNAGVSTYADVAGIATVSQGLTGTPNITVGTITAVDASFSGNVSIAGTLTYEDVTNVDAIGLVTARSGVTIGPVTSIGSTLYPNGDANFAGIVTASSFSGVFLGNATTSSYADVAGVSTNVSGGTGSLTELNVSGLTTSALLNVGVGGTIITTTNDPRVGINSTAPGYTLDVGGDVNFSGALYQNGQLFTSGIGIGSTSVNPGSGVINQRIGIGFTDLNIVGTGITITGYGSTVVIDFSQIAAGSATGTTLSISTITSLPIQDIAFVGGASTSVIGIATATDPFVYDPVNNRVGIGTSLPAYKLDVVGDINSSTSVKIQGVDVLEEAVRLAIAFG